VPWAPAAAVGGRRWLAPAAWRQRCGFQGGEAELEEGEDRSGRRRTRAAGVGPRRQQRWCAAGGLNGDDGLRLRVWRCKSMGVSRTRWSAPQGIEGQLARCMRACASLHVALRRVAVAQPRLVPGRGARGLERAESPRCRAGPRRHFHSLHTPALGTTRRVAGRVPTRVRALVWC
jgi:hypothetical protein